MRIDKRLAVFMHEPAANRILREAIKALPEKTEAYFVGGAVRNAAYYKIFKKKLPSRDYDMFVNGKVKKFVKNLQAKKFELRKNEPDDMVLRKRKFPGARELDEFVWVEMHLSPYKTITENLEKKSNFTINGLALPLESAISPNWYEHIIALPGSLKDLSSKQLRFNMDSSHPTNFYATLRFMAKGFKQPPAREVKKLVSLLKKMKKKQFDRNMAKVFNYVGGEAEARKLAKKLGVKVDVFNWRALKKYFKK